MRILFLSPEPFFQERGTPIAVRLALQVLAKRRGDQIDLLTYHEGADVPIPNVTPHRISAPGFVKNVGPGISWRKLICDVIFLFTALRLVRRSGDRPYQLVHAVEESVFVAWLIRRLFRVPYIYDMDSSIALQLTEKWWWLKPLFPIFQRLEKIAVQGSLAVVPVCDALALIAKRHGSHHTWVLSDISLLDLNKSETPAHLLREEIGLSKSELLVVYIGNLERYQGIDLLLESFGLISGSHPSAHLVIIGGQSAHIDAYCQRVAQLGLQSKVHLLGAKPVSSLSDYLRQADILVSPRTKGNNTPMKIYSYLHSGVPILATNLPTHTQVLSTEVSKLAEPEPSKFAQALGELLENAEERARLGSAARALAQSRYTLERFQETLDQIYDTVAGEIKNQKAA